VDRETRNATVASPLRDRQHGVTLIELMVVVAIIAIIASIGYPSYMGYVTRANRTAAKSLLLQVADRQEQFFANNKRYTADLTDLGYAANGFMINNQGAFTVAGADDRIYAIRLTNATPVTYTVNASPVLRQAGHDAQCQTLTLTHSGVRSQTGPSTECW
jgi:type IV pilus assembly protein PilE